MQSNFQVTPPQLLTKNRTDKEPTVKPHLTVKFANNKKLSRVVKTVHRTVLVCVLAGSWPASHLTTPFQFLSFLFAIKNAPFFEGCIFYGASDRNWTNDLLTNFASFFLFSTFSVLFIKPHFKPVTRITSYFLFSVFSIFFILSMLETIQRPIIYIV